MKKTLRRSLVVTLLAGLTTSCGTGIIGQAGPSSSAILNARGNELLHGIAVVDLSGAVVANLAAVQRNDSFADRLGNAAPVGMIVQPGDMLEVSVWEAPPATLFGPSSMGSANAEAANGPQASISSTLPQLLVGLSGKIFIPFAGEVQVAGRSADQIANDITARLQRKAHLPQVIVRIVRNATANVNVVGEVANSTRLALTPKGERLLDALAQAGGTRHPSSSTMLQITRGDRVIAMPMDAVIRDPRQNIVLETGDVVSVIYQPFSFTALGAAGRNEEIKFEGVGLSLAQGLGRIGGLQADRAKAQSVFIFRWESVEYLPAGTDRSAEQNSKVPVIYRINLRDPATLFLAQNFQMHDGDVLYVSTAPITEFQQFVNLISSTVLPIIAVKNSVQ